MPKASRPKPSLEVSLMYEPHRQQGSLLREAYRQLLAETRRPVSDQGSLGCCEKESATGAERKRA